MQQLNDMGWLPFTGIIYTIVVRHRLRRSSGSGTTVEEWRVNGGLDRLTALSTDFSTVEDAGRAHDIDGMSSACLTLQADTEAAQAYSPIPDPEAQAHWAAALEHLARASSTCVTALQFDNAALFSEASDEMDAVPTAMSQVINRLKALSR